MKKLNLLIAAVMLVGALGCTNMTKTQQGALSGAVIGAGAGAIGGAALSQQPSMEQYRASLYQEMSTYAWRPSPIAPGALVPGYLYFPANLGIHSVRVVLRVDGAMQTFIVPISQAAW